MHNIIIISHLYQYYLNCTCSLVLPKESLVTIKNYYATKKSELTKSNEKSSVVLERGHVAGINN